MKILHCADLHLDSPMETHMTREQAATRNAEMLRSFRRMTEYASREGARLVLIAGDLFDGERVTRRTVEGVLDAVRATPEVDYLYVSGNHDDSTRAFAGEDIPENFKRFSDRWATFVYGDTAVSGVELTADNADGVYGQLPAQDHRVNIVMLHGQVGSASGADCVNLNSLRGRSIHYLALGHIHTYSCQRLDRDGVYCYPGCLEGRGFDECGEKGFVVLDTDARRAEPVFVPFASRQLHRVEVDVTGLATNSQVYQKMREAARGISERDMVEFLLTGGADPSARIAERYLHHLAEHDFFFVKVKDETKLALEPQDYENDVSLKGEFIRLVMASDADDEDKRAMIRAGLEALTGEEITI